jgi:predicted patatin/cPLA2 family phospholipase
MARKPLYLIAILVLAAACGTVPKRNAVPAEEGLEAEIPGIPLARYWADRPPHVAKEWLRLSDQEIEEMFPALLDGEHDYLAISGGGADGAFGAGLLKGWTDTGTRPKFEIVTGISTGALTAPFAFLGPDYDDELRHFYTTVRTKDILEKRSTLVGLTSDAMADSEPLRKLIEQVVTEEMIEKVAEEHRRGRRLLVGTSNLDAMRPVVWNMGVIAASDAPHRVELFRSVLLASASIPGAFPPVFIEVEAGGKTYDEIHVDGGVCAQVFLLPVGMDWKAIEKKLRVKGKARVWVIRNSKLDPKWESVEPSIMALAGRSISSLIRTQGIGDLYRIWIDARENGMDYNLAYVPKSFAVEPKEPFDPEYMERLYDVGYRLAKVGYDWKKAPPGDHE